MLLRSSFPFSSEWELLGLISEPSASQGIKLHSPQRMKTEASRKCPKPRVCAPVEMWEGSVYFFFFFF